MNKPIHILLVEDNKGDVLLISEALEETRHNLAITVVPDGEQALKFLGAKGIYGNRNLPDLILLDINLPRVNGHEVLKYIKSTPGLIQIPVVMLTTSSSETDVMKSYKNYANCYITKPTDVDSYINAVESIEHFWVNVATLPEL